MRRFLHLCTCVTLLCTSCEQEDLLLNSVENNNQVSFATTRNNSTIPSAIDQLDGIPVNIKSVANGKYLSASPDNTHIYLTSNDDGSLRQRWNIKAKPVLDITLIGGNSLFEKGRLIYNQDGTTYYPSLTNANAPLSVGKGIETNDGITYKFGYMVSQFPLKVIHLQPFNANSDELTLDDATHKGNLTEWEIIPVDEFKIEEIKYELTTNDKLSVVPTQIATKTLENNTDISATRTISFQETVSSESTFSELVGLKITNKISASQKVGIAKFINGEFTNETTSEQTWNYTVGNKETQSYTISETVTQEIPPRTTIQAKLIATKYNTNMTYIAKLYGINCHKTIYLKGKWQGAIVQESKITLIQNDIIIKEIPITLQISKQ